MYCGHYRVERTVRCAVIPRVGESLPDMKPEEVTEHNREEGWKKQELSRIQMSLLLAYFNLSILKVENAERIESFLSFISTNHHYYEEQKKYITSGFTDKQQLRSPKYQMQPIPQ